MFGDLEEHPVEVVAGLGHRTQHAGERGFTPLGPSQAGDERRSRVIGGRHRSSANHVTVADTMIKITEAGSTCTPSLRARPVARAQAIQE